MKKRHSEGCVSLSYVKFDVPMEAEDENERDSGTTATVEKPNDVEKKNDTATKKDSQMKKDTAKENADAKSKTHNATENDGAESKNNNAKENDIGKEKDLAHQKENGVEMENDNTSSEDDDTNKDENADENGSGKKNGTGQRKENGYQREYDMTRKCDNVKKADVAEETSKQREYDLSRKCDNGKKADVAEETSKQREYDLSRKCDNGKKADVAEETSKQREYDMSRQYDNGKKHNSEAENGVLKENARDKDSRPKMGVTHAQREHDIQREDERTYAWIDKQFRALAGPDGTLDKETFKKALQVKKSFFADRFFELFDDDNSGSIDLNELLQGLQKLTKGTPAEKLEFLFRIYDADNSGTISREELGTVLRSCMEESSLLLSEDNLEALTDALFDDADTDRSGSITFEELKCQLEKHPGVMNNLTISAAQWLMPPKKKKRPISMPRHLTLKYFLNNRAKVLFTVFYMLLNIGLYVLNCWLYRHTNWYIIIARGAGMCLNFNCAFVLVFMLRKSLTFLRNTPLVNFLPFDQHVMFHKLAGYAIVIFTLIHTGAHLGNAVVFLTKSTRLNLAEILFTLQAGVGWFYGFAPLSGVLLDVILVVMFICSMDFVRRSGYFEVFYWTHKLYVPFFVLNILHGANFWKWTVGPGLIFCIELIFRLKWIRDARYGPMHIEEVHLLPSGVTQLTIVRPVSFHFKPGDYIFVNIPVIATAEWHPFTISSAPEMQGSFTLHIRSAGHWTRLLYTYFQEIINNQSDAELGQANGKDSWKLRSVRDALSFRRRNSKMEMADIDGEPSQPARKINEGHRKRVKKVKVHVPVNVDGPYGTPSRHIFDAEHAILIGSGIGVTPFASILQSIMYRFRETEVTCPSCSYRFCTNIPKSVMSLKKVDFIWINRDQRNFEWFLTLLTKLEREQSRDTGFGHVLDMHMFMTSALTKKDMKGIGLQMALDLIHEHEKTDLITGLQTRTQPGRPDFNKLFTQIASKASGKVKVFFCGAPILGRSLKEACAKHGFSFSQENF